MIVSPQRKLPPFPALGVDQAKANEKIKAWADALLRALEVRKEFIIGEDTIKAEHIADGAVGTTEIADDSVTTPKILNANVTTAKILDAAVTVAKMANDFPFTWAYNNASISLVTATDTLLTFDNEVVDIDGMHSTTVNTSRLTCVRRGYYLIFSMLTFAAHATGTRYAYHILNNTSVMSYDAKNALAQAGVATNVQPWCLYPLAVGDYVETRAYQNSGGNLNVLRTLNYTPFFFAVWLRPYP